MRVCLMRVCLMRVCLRIQLAGIQALPLAPVVPAGRPVRSRRRVAARALWAGAKTQGQRRAVELEGLAEGVGEKTLVGWLHQVRRTREDGDHGRGGAGL